MKIKVIMAAILAASALVSCSGGKSCSGENEVINTIMKRRSIRAYKDTPVEREKLRKIAECGVNAPNGMNRQEWEVRILDDRTLIDEMTAVFVNANPDMARRDPNFRNMFRNAPAVIAIGAPAGEFSGINCGMLGENIILAAESLGLGTCTLGGPVAFLKANPDCAGYLKRFRFSEGYELLYMIAVGYPDEAPAAKPRDLGKIKFVE